MALAEDLRRRILLLDGAMGTMLLAKGIKGCLEFWYSLNDSLLLRSPNRELRSANRIFIK